MGDAWPIRLGPELVKETGSPHTAVGAGLPVSPQGQVLKLTGTERVWITSPARYIS